MIRVYVAGRYSYVPEEQMNEKTVCILNNMRIGMRKCTELMLQGYAPFCPWLDYHYTLMLHNDEKINLQMYYDYSLAWLEVSDAVLLLPGWQESKGTQAEIKRAEELNIPVFLPEEEEAMHDFFKYTKNGFNVQNDYQEAI